MRSAGRSASPSGTGKTASALPCPSAHKIVRQASPSWPNSATTRSPPPEPAVPSFHGGLLDTAGQVSESQPNSPDGDSRSQLPPVAPAGLGKPGSPPRHPCLPRDRPPRPLPGRHRRPRKRQFHAKVCSPCRQQGSAVRDVQNRKTVVPRPLASASARLMENPEPDDRRQFRVAFILARKASTDGAAG
jgi:hypothetical protein